MNKNNRALRYAIAYDVSKTLNTLTYKTDVSDGELERAIAWADTELRPIEQGLMNERLSHESEMVKLYRDEIKSLITVKGYNRSSPFREDLAQTTYRMMKSFEGYGGQVYQNTHSQTGIKSSGDIKTLLTFINKPFNVGIVQFYGISSVTQGGTLTTGMLRGDATIVSGGMKYMERINVFFDLFDFGDNYQFALSEVNAIPVEGNVLNIEIPDYGTHTQVFPDSYANTVRAIQDRFRQVVKVYLPKLNVRASQYFNQSKKSVRSASKLTSNDGLPHYRYKIGDSVVTKSGKRGKIVGVSRKGGTGIQQYAVQFSNGKFDTFGVKDIKRG